MKAPGYLVTISNAFTIKNEAAHIAEAVVRRGEAAIGGRCSQQALKPGEDE
jgi:hypothetical protein